MIRKPRINIPLSVGILCAVGCFVFFQWWYPYHLFHREQMSLFLCDSEFFCRYFNNIGWLSRISGDYLTQFFYYRWLGPTILTLWLTILWVCAYYVCKRICFLCHLSANATIICTIAATILMSLEGVRECALHYNLSTTISLVGWLLIALAVNIRGICRALLSAVVLCVMGFWLFGSILSSQPVSKPDFKVERLLSLDSEAYFGNWAKVAELTSVPYANPLNIYFGNLINARLGALPDSLMHWSHFGAEGLFLPVNPTSNYIAIADAAEVWYQLGDMTMAEHGTMLGMIFSPNHTGTRFLRRLAEINLAKGDNEAALKYLRMLDRTSCHRKWAEAHHPDHMSEAAAKRVSALRHIMPKTDTLRQQNDDIRTLRHLIYECEDNDMAYNYLMCLHLFNKDIGGFMADFNPNRSRYDIYDQALLIGIASGISPGIDLTGYEIPTRLIVDFKNFTEAYNSSGGNLQSLSSDFGDTYWFYYKSIQQ